LIGCMCHVCCHLSLGLHVYEPEPRHAH
jgi:hypothetical protein